MKWYPRKLKLGEGTPASMMVQKEMSQSRSVVVADQQTMGGLPGTDRPGSVSPHIPPWARSVVCVGQLKWRVCDAAV